MRVLHVIKDLEPGGIQTLLKDTFDNKHLFDGQIALFSFGQGRLMEALQKSADPFFYHFKRSYMCDFKLVRALQKTIKEFKPDIVHTHHTAEMLHAFLALRRNHHTVLAHTYHVSPFVSSTTDKYLTKKIEKKFDLLIAPSKALTAQMRQHKYARCDKYHVIPNGISLNRCITPLDKTSCRTKLKLQQDALLIGMAGSFYNNIRDQLTLCKAFAIVAKEHKNSCLVFAGAPVSKYFKKSKAYDDCKRLIHQEGIAHRVIFLDHISPISYFYKSLDIYVHSSKYDTFGLAPVEALMNKIPVIVSDIEVFQEVFQNINNVFFFPTENAADLARLISAQLKTKDTPFKQKAITDAELSEKFGISTYINQLHTLYQKHLKNA